MHFRSLVLAALALAPSALGQITNSSYVTTELASTLLQFRAAGLVPQYIPEERIRLASSLSVSFGNVSAPLGATLARNDTQEAPTLRMNYTQHVDSMDAFSSRAYTTLMVDMGAPGVGFPNGAVVRHYLSNNDTLTGSNGTVMSTGRAVTSYNGPAPPAGSGPHRYTLLVVAQPAGWMAPANLSAPAPLVTDFQLNDYLNYAGLGQIIAASYFIVEGASPTTASVSSTQAVPTASVQAAASTISASLMSAYASPTNAVTSMNRDAGVAMAPAAFAATLMALVAGAALA